MQEASMLFRALLAFLALPFVFAGLVPWAMIAFDPWRGDGWLAGAVPATLGAAGLLWCVRDFYVSGRGTLAPWDPPARLVVAGLYRYTRNPMYVSVLALVAGWALLEASPLAACYTALLAGAFHLRVVWHEEPWLAKTFGGQWLAYSARVPRWLGLGRQATREQ